MIQFKRGSTESWKNNRVPLAAGQPGYDKETHQLKIGDGKQLWSDLPSVNVDSIVETGVSGDWTYQKWESGIARCWCRKEVTEKITTPIGLSGLYQSSSIVIEYPIEFSSTPSETVTIQGVNGITWIANKNKNTEKTSGEYIIISTATQALLLTYSIAVQVEGCWK